MTYEFQERVAILMEACGYDEATAIEFAANDMEILTGVPGGIGPADAQPIGIRGSFDGR